MKTDDRARDPWKAHQSEQRRSWLKLSYAERIRWLDQAKQFVALAMSAARERNRDGKDGVAGGL